MGVNITLFPLKRAAGTVISADEVMRVTCSILSSEFGHGLVKAEPYSAPSEHPPNTSRRNQKGRNGGMSSAEPHAFEQN